MEPEVIEEEISLFEEDGKLRDEPTPIKPNETVNEEPLKFEVPDKFKDKSFEEVVQSYVNLEKMHGNTANEVGELRKLTDQILLNQSQQRQAQEGFEHVDNLEEDVVGFEDLVDDPSEAINRALSKNPTIRKLEQTIMEQEATASRAKLLEAHSDADEVVASPDFQKWVAERPGRQKMLQTAHYNRDVDVAVDLIDMYKATKQAANSEATIERGERAREDLKKAAVETGGAPTTTKRKFRRSELIELKLRDPARYEAMKDEIYAAYAEGRVK